MKLGKKRENKHVRKAANYIKQRLEEIDCPVSLVRAPSTSGVQLLIGWDTFKRRIDILPHSAKRELKGIYSIPERLASNDSLSNTVLQRLREGGFAKPAKVVETETEYIFSLGKTLIKIDLNPISEVGCLDGNNDYADPNYITGIRST
jgi:hypothetical protein